MKRMLVILLVLALACPALASAAERKPAPIDLVPYEELPQAIDGQHHYLLLCCDQWNATAWTGHQNKKVLGYTDGMVLVTVDTRAHRVMLTSFIRDAIVQKPDQGDKITRYGRLNSIYRQFGPEELCRVISQHIGVKIEKYLLFGFSQISNIVDALGGVDLTITDAEASYLRRYAISKKSTSPSVKAAGTYRFYGHASVIYMRIRKAGGGGDFMRTQRVRTVLSTLADQCREISYDDARKLVDTVLDNTTMTNMALDEMVEAMNYAYGLRGCTIEELRIPVDGTVKPITFASMSAEEVDWTANRAAMNNYLNSSFLVMDDEEDDLFD